jgi:hypothetical protein
MIAAIYGRIQPASTRSGSPESFLTPHSGSSPTHDCKAERRCEPWHRLIRSSQIASIWYSQGLVMLRANSRLRQEIGPQGVRFLEHAAGAVNRILPHVCRQHHRRHGRCPQMSGFREKRTRLQSL